MRLLRALVFIGLTSCVWAFGPEIGGGVAPPTSTEEATDEQAADSDTPDAAALAWPGPGQTVAPARVVAPATSAPTAAGADAAVADESATGFEPPPPAPATAEPEPETECCKICRGRQACGDRCISRRDTCRLPPGCACDE